MAWPQYTTSKEEYLGLSPDLTLRSKMRPDKMALWNELLPSIEETIKPTASSHIPTTSEKTEDKTGTYLTTTVKAGSSGPRLSLGRGLENYTLFWRCFSSLTCINGYFSEPGILTECWGVTCHGLTFHAGGLANSPSRFMLTASRAMSHFGKTLKQCVCALIF